MTYDELKIITLRMRRRFERQNNRVMRDTDVLTFELTPDEWLQVRADHRILNHVDYSVQERAFKMNGVKIKVKK